MKDELSCLGELFLSMHIIKYIEYITIVISRVVQRGEGEFCDISPPAGVR